MSVDRCKQAERVPAGVAEQGAAGGAEAEGAAVGGDPWSEAVAPSAEGSEHLAELIADAAEAAAPPPQPAAGVLARRSLRIALNGESRKAHQLTARGGAGWEDKTQLLFVTPDGGFGRAQLVEKLRALELVLGFELTVDPQAGADSEAGEQEQGEGGA